MDKTVIINHHHVSILHNFQQLAAPIFSTLCSVQGHEDISRHGTETTLF